MSIGSFAWSHVLHAKCSCKYFLGIVTLLKRLIIIIKLALILRCYPRILEFLFNKISFSIKHDNTAPKFNFEWNKNVIYAKIIKIDNFHLVNNGSILHTDLIFLYRYNGKAFRIGNKKNLTNYKIDEDTLKRDLNEMLSYCDWFTFTANSIIDASMYLHS